MKKFALAVALCCFFCPVFLAPSVSAWDENGHCHKCDETGDPVACRECNKSL